MHNGRLVSRTASFCSRPTYFTALLLTLASAVGMPSQAVAAPSSKPATASKPVSAAATTTDADATASDDSFDSDETRPHSGSKPDVKAVHDPVPAVPVATRAPPAPPKPDAQEPRPYVAPPEAYSKDRRLTLSVVAGPWWHGMNGKGASTQVGPVWGVSGRVEPTRWLGLRVTVLRGNQPVVPDYGAMGAANTQIQQPDFQIIYWSIRMEPTWHVTPTFLLWAGTGLGWARAIVPEPTIGTLNWRTADRACVYVEGQWAVGAAYELVRNWLEIGVDLSVGALSYQHGSAHDPIQAITPEGHMTHVGGYPNLQHKMQALFGVGVIL